MIKSRTRQTARQAQTRNFLRLSLLGFVMAGLILFLIGSTVAYGSHLENNNSFCASCHTEPESTYVTRAQQPAADLASAHTAKRVACIDCHSGAGPLGRLGAMTIGAHDLAAYVSGHYTQPAPLTHSIPDVNCLKCHRDVLQNRTFDNHFHFLLSRWQTAAPKTAATCVSCHASHATDGESRLAWLNEPRTVAQCNGCHRVVGED